MAGVYGLGATLTITSTGSTNDTLVELTNIGDLNMTADDIDISSHAARIKQYLKGQVELGEIPFTGNYMVAQGPSLYDHLASGSSTDTQTLSVPGALTLAVSGYLKAFGFGVPHDGKVSLSGAVKLSGHSVSLSS